LNGPRSVFYDLFERDGRTFAEKFGYVFDQYVGHLLGSVLPLNSLVAAAWDVASQGKTEEYQQTR